MQSEIERLSKTNVLNWLKPRVKNSRIEDIFYCTVHEWVNGKEKVVEAVCERFKSERLIVRSSAFAEDTQLQSQAGAFHSELNVEPKPEHIREAVERVVASYSKSKVHTKDDQILIQPQTRDIIVSGVIFTRQIGTNAPYYVINFDERSGRTDTVTGGMEGQTVYISHFNGSELEEKWANLLRAVKEIEALFSGQVLDIEFAITRSNRVVIFQVRPLAANSALEIPQDEFVEHLIIDMAKKFNRYSRRIPHLAGEGTVFGDMPDWNPSEIIGSRPNTLDYTIYSFIVTDEIWHEARTSLGYYDVFPAELMVSFAKKPYIDTRISFNSLTPVDISDDLREKLINFYLGKLKKNPSLQDKVEFEILWTCYDFSTDRSLEALLQEGFTRGGIDEFKQAIKRLTARLLQDYQRISQEDLDMVRFLTDRREQIIAFHEKQEKTPWEILNTAFHILQNCKKYGTLPFSRQARLAFIAKSLLNSLKDQGVITEDFYHDFFNSIRTVASQFNDDSYLFQDGKLSKKDFLKRYGHLRAGTYDITTPRYDQSSHLFSQKAASKATKRPDHKFEVSPAVYQRITDAMRERGLNGKAEDLLNFIRSATENREYAKFEFTKSLSDALELIAEAGELLGFKREELCHADLPTLMKFRNPEKGDHHYARHMIQQSIDRHKKEREWYDLVILPPVIASVKDFYFVAPYEAKPNFITKKNIQGKLLPFNTIKTMQEIDLSGHIVLLENADPGFDWIFAKSPMGIITKYGGVASHISIRCAEFGIPAAIGCGELIYERLLKSEQVFLDCEKKIITPLTEMGQRHA
ncbi:MAG TPA: PEP/pyruvate-binding domain-containing protein [Candidatus Omnitrophota bacterium]|nr:PEP/pyruvate-binding domain-containing protein [Candidatus Omnitrophota bacterium]